MSVYDDASSEQAVQTLLRSAGRAQRRKQPRRAEVLKNDQKKFEEKFEALNSDESHFRNRNDICTPMGCVREMVNAIPKSFWRRKSIEVLDPCAGNGNFHAYIRNFVPLGNLTFNEINSARIANIRRLFEDKVQVTKKDFLNYDDQKQYDLIVSNPPYAMFKNGKRVSKNHNLSRLFIEKALRLTKPNGLMLFIVPNNWMSLSDRNVLPEMLSQYQFLHLNIHGAKRWFPHVGSTFTWFLLKKTANKNPFKIENNYIFRNTVKATLPRGTDYIPLHYTNMIREIFSKTIDTSGNKQGIETTSDLHRYTKNHLLSEHPSKDHPYKVIHTPTTVVWSERPHKYQNGWKVFLSLTNTYQIFVDNCGMTQSVAFIRCKSKEEALQRKQELDNPVFRFLNDMTRYGNFNNIRILQRFPRLKDVNLTQQEQMLIQGYWNSYGQ